MKLPRASLLVPKESSFCGMAYCPVIRIGAVADHKPPGIICALLHAFHQLIETNLIQSYLFLY
jgi:hypothetical protein